MFPRFLTDLVLFTAAFFTPWWLVVPGAALLLFRYHSAYELIVLGVILDALYGLPVRQLGGFRFPFTVLCTLLFLMLEFLRPRLRAALGPVHK
ncbi:MAG: hypothetical protein Q8R39_04070 [bacterium]|nr:hypothetical protein [bacterium]MDZ4285257.1 hypothetical protein [Patescibacteria group bacterium]